MNYKVIAIDSQTWRIEEYDEWTCVYMYLLIGNKSALLIDTGMGQIPLRQIVGELTSLPLEVANTHGHIDHTGANILFDRVYMHEADEEVYGFHCSKAIRKDFPMYQFVPQKMDISYINENHIFDLGGRRLSVLLVPGHTPGSICLLDETNRALYTGDVCCQAGLLLNLDYSMSVSQYLEAMGRLNAQRSRFDITWPAHHSVPIPPEIIDRFMECAGQICAQPMVGEEKTDSYYPCRIHRYKDIWIEYFEQAV